MQIGPFSISLAAPAPLVTLDLTTKDVVGPVSLPNTSPTWSPTYGGYGGGGWWSLLRESFAGAWQRNILRSRENVLTFPTVYACLTLIASDIGKLCLDLVQENDQDETWQVVTNPAYSPVLRKPNHYQTRQQFIEQWVLSKLTHGNTYVLKGRDSRGVVTDKYILDPSRVRVLVSPDGQVFYELKSDYLSGLTQDVAVPAREIIHDRMNTLYHPLVGISPISACALAASQGLHIQEQSAHAFAHQLNPGGVLSTTAHIPPDTAARLEKKWEENYAGPNNFGRVAVLGDGLKFDKMMLTAVDAQLIDQLKWTSEAVCSCFHVPAYMVGVGNPPNYNNIEALNQQYYSQCLQALIEAIECSLEEGLGLGAEYGNSYGVEFDLDGLLRMDSATMMKTAADGVQGGIYAPNEARKKFNLKPAKGGDSPMLQQQNYSLEALAKRDAASDPFASVRETYTGQAPAPPDATGEKGPPPPAEPPPPKKDADLDFDLLLLELKACAIEHDLELVEA